jgi:hypothetical protein
MESFYWKIQPLPKQHFGFFFFLSFEDELINLPLFTNNKVWLQTSL